MAQGYTFFLALILSLVTGCEPGHNATPLYSQETAKQAPVFIGEAATPKPVQGIAFEHPYMATSDGATIHTDSYNSDVHLTSGILGKDPEIFTREGPQPMGGMCSTTTFSQKGLLISLCANLLSFQLHLMDPETLDLLAVHYLPSRPSSFGVLTKGDPKLAMTDTSGGAYHYLDHKDRIVLADSTQHIVRIAHRQTANGEWEFYEDGRWDLSEVIPHDCYNWNNLFPSGECDPITAVLPDIEGNFWWTTRRGRYGAINPQTGKIIAQRFWTDTQQQQAEEIQNSFAVDNHGAYIATDHAVYALRLNETNEVITTQWRETYDRGSYTKVGTINQGTGTTPTLIGDKYLAISDNADDLINLVVYRRDPEVLGRREVCKVPLFDQRGSVTDNSVIGWGQSVIIENNAHYSNAFEMTAEAYAQAPGGVMRVDIREDDSGCDIVWRSAERSLSPVPKLSAANGIIYLYGPDMIGEQTAWYLKGVDFETGQTLFRIHTGNGQAFDNNWAPISIGKDGTTYIGSFKGLIGVRDRD